MNKQMYLRDDPDQQNLIDWIQEGWLQCCGIEGPTVSLIFKNFILKIILPMINCHTTIKSLKKNRFWKSCSPWLPVQLISNAMLQDWDKNIYFNCSSEAVGSREACGVPFRFSLFSRFWNLLVISFLICLCFLFNLYICPVASPVLGSGVQLASFLTFCTFFSSIALVQLLQAQGQRTDQEQAVRLWRQEAGLCEYLSYLCLKVIIFNEPWAPVIGITIITIADNASMSERKMKH